MRGSRGFLWTTSINCGSKRTDPLSRRVLLCGDTPQLSRRRGQQRLRRLPQLQAGAAASQPSGTDVAEPHPVPAEPNTRRRRVFMRAAFLQPPCFLVRLVAETSGMAAPGQTAAKFARAVHPNFCFNSSPDCSHMAALYSIKHRFSADFSESSSVSTITRRFNA